jgi:histone H3/H4
MPKLSLAAMSKLMKSSGAQRVSDSAKKKLREILENKAKNVTNKAIKFAKYKGRLTVKGEDIEKALR